MSTQIKEKTSKAVGIDLGTTYSCVAVYKNGQPEVIVNTDGQRTTPSVVAFGDDKRRYVGNVAEYMAGKDPKKGIFGSKRAIGRGFDDKELQHAIQNFPFDMVRWDRDRNCETSTVADQNEVDNVRIKVQFKDEVKYYEPAEISGHILSHLKSCAESVLGHNIEKGVITVPAYFNDNQREKTKVAALIAGFKDVRLVNEPKAAAMAYGHGLFTADPARRKAQTVMVFDLGGGTFDVTIMRFEEPNEEGSVAEVLATDGDTFLGGMDFDNLIFDYCLNMFLKQNPSIKKSDIKPKAMRRLRTACEKAKRLLSSSTETTVSVDCFHGEDSLDVVISRVKFNDLCKRLFEKCMEKVKGCLLEFGKSTADYNPDGFLRNCNMSVVNEMKNKIDRVLMIGGSSRIPRIREMLSEFFGGHKIDDSVNPDEAVALGAAFQAALLADDADLKPCESLLLLDAIPLNISIETAGGVAHTMIPKNTTIPINKSETFTTYSDNQPAVTINIYEGTRPKVADNHLIGSFMLDGIQPAPRGVPQIEVTCEINHDGILVVRAVDKGTNNQKELTVSNVKGRLSQDEINKMIEEEEKYKEADKMFNERIKAKQTFEGQLYSAKSVIEKSQTPQEIKDNILNKLKEHENWLNANPEADKNEYERRSKEIQDLISSQFQQGGAGMGNPNNFNPDNSGGNSGPGGVTVEEVD
ncbi:Heat shock like protein [Dictyocoela roeselum]|nr:Heat shock like protein [Dictyocoela roeselum]